MRAPLLMYAATRQRAVLLMALALMFIATGCNRNESDPNMGSSTNNVNLQLVADGFTSPLGVVESPDGTNRLFVIDQAGKIWLVRNGQKDNTPFLDLTSKIVTLSPQYDERGLLGMAFHPNFRNNKKFYVFYTAPPRAGGPEAGTNWNNLTRVSEFRVVGNGEQADLSTERVLLEADHPQMNHNGGTIAFGPDGYLYISIGDGGGSNDVGPGHVTDWYAVNKGGNAQNIHANWMGKILRIDVNSGSPYGIPSDNPFAGTSAKQEIWAYGFRNPYRFSFDMGGSRQLYVGDAGQRLFEEIDVVIRGGNYGWNVKEGSVCFNADSSNLIRPDCPTQDSMGNKLQPPMLEMKNSAHPEGGGIATVVVGGNVYRGGTIPSLNGYYIFGVFNQHSDQMDGKLYSAMGSSYTEIKLKDYPNNLGMYLKGFGQDSKGEIYITTSTQAGVNGSTGKVYRLVSAP